MERTLAMPDDPARLALLDAALARLEAVSARLPALAPAARREVRPRLLTAFQSVEAARAGEGDLEAVEAALQALAPWEAPSVVPEFRPLLRPHPMVWIRSAVREPLVQGLAAAGERKAGAERFSEEVLARLPQDLVRSLLRDGGPRTGSSGEEGQARESFELLWKHVRR
jgi:hypothetical protein